MTAILDLTDNAPLPTCAHCRRQGSADSFTTQLVYAKKFDARGKLEMQGIRYTVCRDTDCGAQQQRKADS